MIIPEEGLVYRGKYGPDRYVEKVRWWLVFPGFQYLTWRFVTDGGEPTGALRQCNQYTWEDWAQNLRPSS